MELSKNQTPQKTKISIFVCCWANEKIGTVTKRNILNAVDESDFEKNLSLYDLILDKSKFRQYQINSSEFEEYGAAGREGADEKENFYLEKSYLFSLKDACIGDTMQCKANIGSDVISDETNEADGILGISVIEFVFQSKKEVTDKDTADFIKSLYQPKNKTFAKYFRKKVDNFLKSVLGAELLFHADSGRIICTSLKKFCISEEESDKKRDSYLICPFFFVSSYSVNKSDFASHKYGEVGKMGTRTDIVKEKYYGERLSVLYMPIGCGIYHDGILLEDGNSRIYNAMLIAYLSYMGILLRCEFELNQILAKVSKTKRMSKKEKSAMENIRSRYAYLDKISLNDFCPVQDIVRLRFNLFRDYYAYFRTGMEVNKLREMFNSRLTTINKTLSEQTNELLSWLSIFSVVSCGSAFLSIIENLSFLGKPIRKDIASYIILAVCAVVIGCLFYRFNIKKSPGIIEINENENSDFGDG